MNNIDIINYIKDNDIEFSSLELCLTEDGKTRLAIKSYNKKILYEFINDNDLINNVINAIDDVEFMKFEYGVSFDSDTIKIYYIEQNSMSIIGIDILNCNITRTKRYSVDTIGNIICKDILPDNSIYTTIYNPLASIYEFQNSNIIKKVLNFEYDCEYIINLDKRQYYLRIQSTNFNKHYNNILTLLT